MTHVVQYEQVSVSVSTCQHALAPPCEGRKATFQLGLRRVQERSAVFLLFACLIGCLCLQGPRTKFLFFSLSRRATPLSVQRHSRVPPPFGSLETSQFRRPILYFFPVSVKSWGEKYAPNPLGRLLSSLKSVLSSRINQLDRNRIWKDCISVDLNIWALQYCQCHGAVKKSVTYDLTEPSHGLAAQSGASALLCVPSVDSACLFFFPVPKKKVSKTAHAGSEDDDCGGDGDEDVGRAVAHVDTPVPPWRAEVRQHARTISNSSSITQLLSSHNRAQYNMWNEHSMDTLGWQLQPSQPSGRLTHPHRFQGPRSPPNPPPCPALSCPRLARQLHSGVSSLRRRHGGMHTDQAFHSLLMLHMLEA